MNHGSRFALAACVVSLVAGRIAAAAVESPALPAAPSRLAGIAANDNSRPGGRLVRGTLRIALVARRGLWYPDGAGSIGIPIEAFGEAGAAPRIPGPLVRVPVGTRVVASVRNELAHDLTVRGLAAPAAADTTALRVPRGQTRRVSFVADRAGAFGYYGSDAGETVDARYADDAELSGAIVVDPAHGPRVDHVFVLGLYSPVNGKDGPNFLYLLETINGRSYPATERLTYERGTRVRWAVYNGSAMLHPMHLHGFYFRTGRIDAYDEVTHPFHPGDAEELSWTADRAGSWMFHCHISDHITKHAPLRDILAKKADPAYTIADRFHRPNLPLAGMVVAIEVRPRPNDRPRALPANPRRLALDVSRRDVPPGRFGVTQDAYTLRDGDRTIPPTGSLGPPIVLERGRPVAIAVTNHLGERTSVHWHGIALDDSYDDGGAGMGMVMGAARMSPPIETGATFVARFTPPDAGTFTYHAHMDDGWQLAGGLVGPLIVMPPGVAFDPRSDHIVMISEAFETVGGAPLGINGSLTPPPLPATVGVPQRLRFANLTLGGQSLVVSLVDGGRVIAWTPIAKDGRDLPARLRRSATATHELTIGETRDFRFTPSHAGTLVVDVYDQTNGNALVASQRIEVADRVASR